MARGGWRRQAVGRKHRAFWAERAGERTLAGELSVSRRDMARAHGYGPVRRRVPDKHVHVIWGSALHVLPPHNLHATAPQHQLPLATHEPAVLGWELGPRT